MPKSHNDNNYVNNEISGADPHNDENYGWNLPLVKTQNFINVLSLHHVASLLINYLITLLQADPCH